MKIEKIRIWFIWLFAFIPIGCVLMELILNATQGLALKPGDIPKLYPFDVILVEQLEYFSVWAAIITSCWGITNVINHFKKGNKIKWGESDNVLTMVFTYNFVTSLIYTGTMIMARDTIVGFNSSYSIAKSTLEHWVIPLLFVIYYFGLRDAPKTNIKVYIKTQAWKNMIVPFIYIVFIITRTILLHEVDFTNKDMIPRYFPYEQVDPYNTAISNNAAVRWLITLVACSAALVASFGLGIFFEWTSSMSSLKFQNKFFINGKINFKNKN